MSRSQISSSLLTAKTATFLTMTSFQMKNSLMPLVASLFAIVDLFASVLLVSVGTLQVVALKIYFVHI